MAFLFTDIVSSTALWERFPDAMPDALRRHDTVLERAVATFGGAVMHRSGDGMIASFPTVDAAAKAAAEAQRVVLDSDWTAVDRLGVRMGVHCGPVVMRDGEPYGWALNFGSRLCDVGSAGQILISEAAVRVLDDEAASEATATPIATVHLRDIAEPVVVHQLLVAGLPDRFPDLRDVNAAPPLPVPPDEFVGRAPDLALLDRLARQNRLITLVGPPGVGTSRLGVEFVNRALGHHPDGAVRVDLAISSGTDVETVAATIGVQASRGRSLIEAITDWLHARRMVLLVDRGNRVDGDLGALVESILVSAPAVTIVCAGRRPLGVAGEIVHHVGPLPPDEAVRLMASRVPAAPVDGADDVMRQIVQELDGLPLALEVAGAAADMYSWAEILELLRRTEPGFADSSDRTVSVPLTIGCDELPAHLLPMLVAATVFGGRFDRAAFHAVCAPDLDTSHAVDGLGQLVDRSLVSRESSGDRTWFRLLGPVRQVVMESGSVSERKAAEQRLERWATQFATAAAAGLRGPEERLWNRRIESQFGNLRIAFERSADRGEIETAATLATVLWDYGFMRFNPEYLGWSLRLVGEFADSPPEVMAPVHGVAALAAWIGDDLDGVVEHAHRALEMEASGGLDFDLPARLALISASVYSGASSPPERVYTESADYQREQSEAYFHVNVDTQNSVMARWLGDRETAVVRAARAVKIARQSENPSSLAFALWALGGAMADDDPVYAETHLATSLDLAREAGNRWVTALAQMSLASIRHRTSGPMAAVPILVDLLDVLTSSGHRTHVWSSLRLAAVVLADLGDDELAVQIAAWVRDVGLAMPAFPSDQALLDVTSERIYSERGREWVRRMEVMSSTWTPETATTLVRDALAQHLDRARPGTSHAER